MAFEQNETARTVAPFRSAIGTAGALVALVAFSIALAGCLPSSGPTAQALVAGANAEVAPYAFVQLSPQLMPLLGIDRPEGFGSIGSQGSSPSVLLGVGDIITVTVFEAAPGGLFIPADGGNRSGNFVELPEQTVDNAGNIAVPYVGAVRAAGRGIPDLQGEIVSRMPARAIDPQVVITLQEQRSTQVSVLGAVNDPARFAINPSGDRVLDAIARAGGPEFPTFETYVTLQRGGNQATEKLSEIIANPSDNVYVRPGDTLVLTHDPETFVAVGASGRNAQVPFEADRVSLAEALGKAGGPADARANPSSVFIYRLEYRTTVERMGRGRPEFVGFDLVPTIYAIDLRDPSGYFMASAFAMRDKDVLYIANAPIADLNKLFAFVSGAA
ncbi:MAG: polysaccharide export protein, partial [Bauldia sp.]|nr:polysaccharide export protein [Bauldia sp.]